MKNSFVAKVVGSSVLAASLAVVPLTLPVHAQTDNTTTNSPDNATTTSQNVEGDRDFDWGWLGLLGLIGLGGLARRSHSEPKAYADPAETRQTSDRY